MNLLEFRQFFRKTSGRYDLVNADGSDNGANVFINEGQKYLDRLVDLPTNIGRRFIDLSSGKFLVTFEQCRSIQEVWCVGPDTNGDMVRLPVKKYSQQELRGVDPRTLEAGYVELASTMEADRPQYYSPAQLRLVTAGDGTTGGIGGMMDVMATGHQTYSGVYLMPPADQDYVIEVVGNFYQDKLVNDTDYTYWSEQPMLLYMATMLQLEIVHRNSTGVNDWKASIMDSIVGLDMDGVAEESAGVNQLEG